MLAAIQPQNEHDKRLQGPQTARGRLYEWARVRHWLPINAWPPESAMYAVLHNPGRAPYVQGDGGMLNRISRMQTMPPESHVARERCREVQAALDMMPKAYLLVVRSMYEVERRERVKKLAEAAETAHMEEANFRKTMDMALAWLQGRLNLDQVRGPDDREGLTEIDSTE